MSITEVQQIKTASSTANLLLVVDTPNKVPTKRSYSTTDMFKAHLKKYGLTGFGGKQITTKYDANGNLKKSMGIVFKDWTQVITSQNYEDYVMLKWTDKDTGKVSYNQPKSFYIKTGQDAGYIGIDFDTVEAYNAFIKANPECSKYFTQKTKKGFHILFHYDERLNHSCSNDKHAREDCKIDFRSNGGCLISYPTKYYHHQTNEEYSYDIYVDGELGTITNGIIKYFDDNGIVYYEEKTDTKSRMTEKKKKVKKEIEAKIVKVQEKLGEINSQSGKLFIRMCQCFLPERICNYSSWFEMGCMLKNHFVNKGNEKEGIDCFKYFSSLKDANGKMFYKEYDLESVLVSWGKMEVYKVKKVDRNKSWEKIKLWAKIDNADMFNVIFDISELNLTSSYSDLKTAFEETNFKVRNPVSFCEVVKIDGQDELVFRSPTDLNTLYENLFWTEYKYKPAADGEGEGTFEQNERSFIKDWRLDTELKEYERVDFRPYCLKDNTPKNIYNQFRGFNALKYYKEWLDTPEDKRRKATDTDDGIGLLLQHHKDLAGNPAFYEYLLDCLAFKIQFPHLKNNIAVIIKSLQGAGKDSLLNFFGNEIIGSKYYLNIQGLNQLENFNSLLSCKLLVVLNEFELKESISNREKFKALITNMVNVINEKFEKQRKEKDFTMYFLLTNNVISFSVETGDRRITATESNNKICNDKAYFDKLYQNIYGIDKNGECVGKDYIAPFFHFLLQRKVENKDWINTRVKTEYYKTLQDYSISPLVRFFEYLNNKYYKYGVKYNGKADKVEGNKSIFTATSFYNMFKDFRTEWGYKSADWSATLFGTNLRQFCVEDKSDGGEYLKDYDETFKFIVKKKISISAYVLDNEKMINYLVSEGIIEKNGTCLITMKNRIEQEIEYEEEEEEEEEE
jgi:hypothetical protein